MSNQVQSLLQVVLLLPNKSEIESIATTWNELFQTGTFSDGRTSASSKEVALYREAYGLALVTCRLTDCSSQL